MTTLDIHTIIAEMEAAMQSRNIYFGVSGLEVSVNVTKMAKWLEALRKMERGKEDHHG